MIPFSANSEGLQFLHGIKNGGIRIKFVQKKFNHLFSSKFAILKNIRNISYLTELMAILLIKILINNCVERRL